VKREGTNSGEFMSLYSIKRQKKEVRKLI